MRQRTAWVQMNISISLSPSPRKCREALSLSYSYRKHLQRWWCIRSDHNTKYSWYGLCWMTRCSGGRKTVRVQQFCLGWPCGLDDLGANIFSGFSPVTFLINRHCNSYKMEWQKWSFFQRNVSGGKAFKGLRVPLLYLMGPLAHKHIKQRNNRSLGEF